MKTLYKWRGSIIVALILVYGAGMYWYGENSKKHSCAAPCTVRFDKTTAEDDIVWNYQAGHTVFVFKNGAH